MSKRAWIGCVVLLAGCGGASESPPATAASRASSTASPAAPAAAPTPVEIAVDPATAHVVLRAPAKGVQIYRCDASAWKLVGPDAALFDDKGATIGRHTAGPTWELSDGSKVVGAMQAKASVGADAIPWLRLDVTSNAGAGVLRGVKTIQRVQTRGGVAPAGPCEGSDEKRIDYEATYVFWAP